MRLPVLLLLFFALPAIADVGPVNPQVVSTIAFGSCAKQGQPQPVWEAIAAQRPDLFLFIGDNVYADRPDDPESVGDIAEAYRALGAQPGYQKLRSLCPLLATWDDHDFGLNDAGKEWPLKRQSQLVMLSFFREPAKSPRWSRDGVYGAWMFGPEGRRVQVILLDTRFFRDALIGNPDWKNGDPTGPYVAPAGVPGGTVLGRRAVGVAGRAATQAGRPANRRL